MTMSSSQPVLLVLRHHGLGDLVTAQPALRALRRSFPRHRIVTTCPSWLVDLAVHFGTADQLISELPVAATSPEDCGIPTQHQGADPGILANLLSNVHDVDVLVSMRTPGSELVPLVETLQPRVLVSYKFAPLKATTEYPELDFNDHILTRWSRLLKCIDIHPRESDLYAVTAAPDSPQGLSVVHVGAGSPARLWPVERWSRVVQHLEKLGHHVVLTGSRNEVDAVVQVQQLAGLPSERNRCGRDDVMKLAGLVAGARFVVSVDTGVAHLATAFRRPALTLFGPVPPAWWGPPPGNPQHRTLWTGRFGEPYDDHVDLGLLEISVEHVLEVIDRIDSEASDGDPLTPAGIIACRSGENTAGLAEEPHD